MTNEWIKKVIDHLQAMGVKGQDLRTAGIKISDYAQESPFTAADHILDDLDSFAEANINLEEVCYE
jgi:hypothetical protein